MEWQPLLSSRIFFPGITLLKKDPLKKKLQKKASHFHTRHTLNVKSHPGLHKQAIRPHFGLTQSMIK